ncbi:MAG: hypothetical protein ABEJ89_05590 [Haloarculaceae archaeon]
MSVGNEGIVGGIRVDLKRLHETWMELVYPRQRGADDTVLGKWTPDSGGAMALYRLWSAIGVPVVGVVYPFVLLGAFLRFQTRRLSAAGARLGVIGVVLLSVVVWGALLALAKFQLNLLAGGVTVLAVSAVVATVAGAAAVGAARVDGRATTVLLAYPFAVTAIFLPPAVAALYSPAVAHVVFSRSDALAHWLLDNVLVGGVGQFFVRNFDREGLAYPAMWLGISFPVGWLLGLLVTLADLVRPTGE